MKKIFKHSALLTLAFFLMSFSNHVAQNSASSVTFTIKNAGLTVDGKFTKFDYTVNYDEKNPEKTTFFGTVDISSINTGISMRDDHLKKDEYFDVQKYPKVTFKSTKVRKIGEGKLEVIGNLTIKNITKTIKINVDIANEGSKKRFKSSFVLNRRNFEVGGKSWTLGDNLTVLLNILS